MLKRISDEIIEIAKKHENLNERMEIYGKMMARYIEGVIVDERMREYLDPNVRRSKKMNGNKNSVKHTDKQSDTHCKKQSVSDGKNSVGHTDKKQLKPKKNEISDDALTIYISNNNELYDIVYRYIQSNIHTGNIQYLINKQGETKYIYSQMLEAEKIIKQIGLETFITILAFIKQDEFWNKQILSIAKLNRKDKDGVPYYIVIMERLKNYRPKVISIPTV